MGNTNTIPVVSQIKSGVQLVCGDVDGAANTQEHFFRECPIVSQATSLGQLIAGDAEGALETQKRCGNVMLNMTDGIPAIGHAKGLIHYAVGDTEGGNKAMKAATRTTGVIAGGAGGFLVGGPVGAVAGGIYAGAAVDTATTAITGQESGLIAAIESAVKDPSPGNIFDAAFVPVADGFAGYSAGQIVNKIQIKAQANVLKAQAKSQANVLEAQAAEIYEIAENGKESMTSQQYMDMTKEAQAVFNKAQSLRGETNMAGTNLKQGSSGSASVGSGPPGSSSGSTSAAVVNTSSNKSNSGEQSKESLSGGSGGSGDREKGSENKKKLDCDGDKPLESEISTDPDRTVARLTKNLPNGSVLRSVTDRGSVIEVATRNVNDLTVVDYSRAIIKYKHLGTGKEVTKKYRQIIQKMGRGQAGHIVGRVLGGYLEDNLFPQNPSLNNSFFKTVEGLIRKFLDKYRNGHVDYQVRLIYNPMQTRPYGLFVLIRYYIGDRLATEKELKVIGLDDNPLFEWMYNPDPDIDYRIVH